MTTRRPAIGYVLLALFWANLSVWCFYQGDMPGTWGSVGALFLTYELWTAILKTGGTLSECSWDVLGIRPWRPWTIARRSTAGLFLIELAAHIVSGGQSWWCGGVMIASTGAPVGGIFAYSLLIERRRNRA